MAALVLFVDLTQVVAISTFALVFTYVITNIAAYKLKTAATAGEFCHYPLCYVHYAARFLAVRFSAGVDNRRCLPAAGVVIMLYFAGGGGRKSFSPTRQ